jgi:hypothetical protein
MCVCGVFGYAQITSGRLSATASATARAPSICLSMALSLPCASPMTGSHRQQLGRGDDSLATAAVPAQLEHWPRPSGGGSPPQC